MAWTDERVDQLKKYWSEGHSASQIAELLGDGLTRNAVIGKAHRLGLAARPSPLRTPTPEKPVRARPARAKAAKPAPAAAAPAPTPPPAPVAATPAAPAPAVSTPPAAAPVSPPAPRAPEPAAATPEPAPASARPRQRKGRVTLLDLNDRICRWPIGHPDKANFHFCGKPVNPGFPYCPEHCLEAYQAQMPRKDRPTPPQRRFGAPVTR